MFISMSEICLIFVQKIVKYLFTETGVYKIKDRKKRGCLS